MSQYQQDTEVLIPQYGVLRRTLQEITDDRKLVAEQMAIAMRFAIKPTFRKLEQYVNALPEVTGNLRRAVASKVKKYSKSGNVVGLVGYRKERKGKDKPDERGRDRAYHQHLIEYGTAFRTTKTGASRGISPRGGTKGVPPMTTAYKETIATVNSRLIQKSQKVVDGTYKKLRKRAFQ